MIIIVGAVLGALFGVYTAKKRGGTGLDVAQYAATYAFVFAIAGVILTVMLMRMV